jgi:hypothetical protein
MLPPQDSLLEEKDPKAKMSLVQDKASQALPAGVKPSGQVAGYYSCDA